MLAPVTLELSDKTHPMTLRIRSNSRSTLSELVNMWDWYFNGLMFWIIGRICLWSYLIFFPIRCNKDTSCFEWTRTRTHRVGRTCRILCNFSGEFQGRCWWSSELVDHCWFFFGLWSKPTRCRAGLFLLLTVQWAWNRFEFVGDQDSRIFYLWCLCWNLY